MNLKDDWVFQANVITKHRYWWRVTLMILLANLIMQAAVAKDLGVYGRVSIIAETDFLVLIQTRLNTLKINGELERLQQTLTTQTRAKAQRPTPVIGLKNTQTAKRWLVDPSITLTEDINGVNGQILHKAGTAVNPLSTLSLSQPLFFFNGDDPIQRDWVEQQSTHTAMLILVNGSVTETADHFDQVIYFDQGGQLIQYFGIKQIPAIVKQRDLSLEITEVIP